MNILDAIGNTSTRLPPRSASWRSGEDNLPSRSAHVRAAAPVQGRTRLVAEPAALSGVVGIVVEGGRLAAAGMALELAVSLSISLAVMNLLPIPVLDGGQVVLSCLEEAFPRAVRLRPAATVLGVLLLAGVMVYANVQDALRYWG